MKLRHGFSALSTMLALWSSLSIAEDVPVIQVPQRPADAPNIPMGTQAREGAERVREVEESTPLPRETDRAPSPRPDAPAAPIEPRKE